jgi:hypothetical protein
LLKTKGKTAGTAMAAGGSLDWLPLCVDNVGYKVPMKRIN